MRIEAEEVAINEEEKEIQAESDKKTCYVKYLNFLKNMK